MDFDIDKEVGLGTALRLPNLLPLRTRYLKLIEGNEFTQYIIGTDCEGTLTEPTRDYNPMTWRSTAAY